MYSLNRLRARSFNLLRSVRSKPLWKSNRTFTASTSSLQKFELGQPVHETRPHLISPGELTQGITALEYYHRRLQLSNNLPANSIAILVGNSLQYRSGSVFYDFHQNPDFFYLSGWVEPESIMVIEKGSSSSDQDVVFHIFVPPKDPRIELWEGARTGIDAAIDFFNADQAYSNSPNVVNGKLFDIISRAQNVFVDLPKSASKFESFFDAKKSTLPERSLQSMLNKAPGSVRPIGPIMRQLRSIKSTAEIETMRRAANASAEAYNEAYKMQFTKEHDLYAFLDYKFRINGCDKCAYIPVIAAGENALSIHYTRNDDAINPNDLVLVDAGGSVGYYCADISRTWPANSGKFTGPQRDLYQAVLNVQKACIEVCKTSSDMSLHDIHRLSEQTLYKELVNIGGTENSFSNLSPSDVTSYLYQHYIGHHLGIDVHDIPGLNRMAPLVENQVITIEPGVYVPDNERWPAHFRGIGIRIEDNVVIGKDSYDVLTKNTLKEIHDIER
ncbi:hypothetical protein NADFUDRAFT_62710 [Nadsonia fulvescens var. elongata DSM 6958]|uniref:Aminopeptidase P N-terminal domain-containing protein n=1 Tax=Nadsonia fulvescens var. elongata DSM 6958 TaxID=857566 RepID=A0A1E3PCX8_9ASCO|nr:hypothetical protein NADFUDRAFT_62710 [Nadsonia fulvescens var. elongata DSM 6958]